MLRHLATARCAATRHSPLPAVPLGWQAAFARQSADLRELESAMDAAADAGDHSSLSDALLAASELGADPLVIQRCSP